MAKTILCIPGPWRDREAIVADIIKCNLGSYIFAGQLLYDVNANVGFEVEIYDADPRMVDSFRYACSVNGLDEVAGFVDSIAGHNTVLYLIGETGSLEGAERIARAGAALIRAGGFGIKVESAGKAFAGAQWLALLDTLTEASLYVMFVVDILLNGVGDSVYSCGMHNLGLKDVIVKIHDDEQAAALEVLSIFCYYLIVDKPTIMAGQTFSVDHGNPVYRIDEETEQPMTDDLFMNPYGMWRLARI